MPFPGCDSVAAMRRTLERELKLPRRGSRLELELSGPKNRPPEDELRLLIGLLRGRSRCGGGA